MMEPVAYKWEDPTGAEWLCGDRDDAHEAAALVGGVAVPLVPQSALSDAEARMEALERELRAANDAHKSILADERARAEAAEALLKEQEADDASLLSKLKVMRGIYAMRGEDYTSRALHNIITEFEAARAIHHKIGVKDE